MSHDDGAMEEMEDRLDVRRMSEPSNSNLKRSPRSSSPGCRRGSRACTRRSCSLTKNCLHSKTNCLHSKTNCLHSIADWVEVQASGPTVTELALYAAAGQPFGVGVKMHKIVKISEVATGDAAFARQLRRKFVQSVA